MSVTWSATELAAVNGVIIPTKLSAGQQPIKGPPCTTRQIGKALPCSRCGTTFPRLYQVRAHFIACIQRNGNPGGLFWDEKIPGRPTQGPRTVTPAVTSTVVETAKRARLDKRNGKIAANTTSFNGIIVPSKVLPGLPPNQGNFFEQRQGIFVGNCTICGRGFMKKHQIQYHFSACIKRNGNPFGRSWTDPFEPWTTKDDGSAKLLSDVSNSQANDDENDHSFAARAEELVDSLQTWQDFILAHGDESALQHPVFLGLMEEMQVQGLIDENWCWLVGV